MDCAFAEGHVEAVPEPADGRRSLDMTRGAFQLGGVVIPEKRGRAQLVDATPSDMNHFSKGGVYDTRKTGQAFRSARIEVALVRGFTTDSASLLAALEDKKKPYAWLLFRGSRDGLG